MVGGDSSVSGGCLLALDSTLRKCEMLLGGVGQSGDVFVHRLLLHVDQEYQVTPEYSLIEQLQNRRQNMGFY